MSLFKRLFGAKSNNIIVVSGLPRSGTSMAMKMLEAGGIEPLIDEIRQPNVDNPKGYYEFERVKKLPKGDVAWLEDAKGKVVKIISQLLLHLPDTHTYQVLFMRRDLDEILASQRKMMDRRGTGSEKSDDETMAWLFDKHLHKVYTWMEAQPNLSYIDVDYNQTLQDPRPQIERISQFLGGALDVEGMLTVVDPSLYRQRR